MEKLHSVHGDQCQIHAPRLADPCVLVIFGATGDLTRRLLVPALYNLRLDGLLSPHFAIVGVARAALTTEAFRQRMAEGVRTFNTRKEFDGQFWAEMQARIHYLGGGLDDPSTYTGLSELVATLTKQLGTQGNVLFYLATPPAVFGPICGQLANAGCSSGPGWKRIIVEKPFGSDLASAQELNRQLLQFWDESQIYRIDHYLGKETVQNILAFRFANAMFEPIWNKRHIDHIQLTVSETVGVESRGGYYDHAGALRDMIQNHMLQMLAYMCMEPPNSFAADDIRAEKARLLKAIRVFTEQDVRDNAVRGQYAAGTKADGAPVPNYRQEPGVDPASNVETYAALRLFIDNERWSGVPMYLRSGKALWKRGTEVVVQFKRPPGPLFLGKAAPKLPPNRLVFHIQPDQAIESCIQAKTPGPQLQLETVNMRFSYGASFRASRGTGYEVLLYSCMSGDATLFSRTDLVEAAWRFAQPILDAWKAQPPLDFPNYAAGTWGPKAASDLMERDGRHWFEVVNRESLERVPLFKGGDPVFLNQISMALQPRIAPVGSIIIRHGETGTEMFVICRGEVEVVDAAGRTLSSLHEGDVFGEVALIMLEPRTATVLAKTRCDLFVLSKADFCRILRDQPAFGQAIEKIARERYHRRVLMAELAGSA